MSYKSKGDETRFNFILQRQRWFLIKRVRKEWIKMRRYTYFTLFREAWFLVNDENVYNDLNDETFLNFTFSDNLHIRFVKNNIF